MATKIILLVFPNISQQTMMQWKPMTCLPSTCFYQRMRGEKRRAEKGISYYFRLQRNWSAEGREASINKTTLLNKLMLSERFAEKSILLLMDNFQNIHTPLLAVYTYQVSNSHFGKRRNNMLQEVRDVFVPHTLFPQQVIPQTAESITNDTFEALVSPS